MTNMTRLYGRIIGVARVVDIAPGWHWCATTMLSALRLDGSTAAMVIEMATDREVFEAYVRHVLTPNLRDGDIVVLDNPAHHKTPAIVAAIEGAGTGVCSPDAKGWFVSCEYRHA
jgi:hypothetical protein